MLSARARRRWVHRWSVQRGEWHGAEGRTEARKSAEKLEQRSVFGHVRIKAFQKWEDGHLAAGSRYSLTVSQVLHMLRFSSLANILRRCRCSLSSFSGSMAVEVISEIKGVEAARRGC